VRLWDAASGKERAKLEGHSSSAIRITYDKEKQVSKARVVSSGGSAVLIWRNLDKETVEIERRIGTGRELMSREASIKNAKISIANKKLLSQRKAKEEDTSLGYHQEIKKVSRERNEMKTYYFGLFFNKGTLFEEQVRRIVRYLDEKSRKAMVCVNKTTERFFKVLSALKESSEKIYQIQDIGVLKKQAAKGEAEAQFRLGVCYDKGEGITRNNKQAVLLYEKAASQNHAYAQNNFGVCYEQGLGLEKNFEKAKMYYQEATLNGHISAKNNLEKLLRAETAMNNATAGKRELQMKVG
jgi:TPR repeat protein